MRWAWQSAFENSNGEALTTKAVLVSLIFVTSVSPIVFCFLFFNVKANVSVEN